MTTIINDPKIFYIEDRCHKWTFHAQKVKDIVEFNCVGRVLNLFSGLNHLNVNETRIDKPDAIIDFQPDYCMDAFEFLIHAISNSMLFDTIIWDPPWNERKAKEKYNGRKIGRFTKLKDFVVKALSNDGKIISIGYEISNFGKVRNMEVKEVHVINPFGEIRPYFISIERDVSPICIHCNKGFIAKFQFSPFLEGCFNCIIRLSGLNFQQIDSIVHSSFTNNEIKRKINKYINLNTKKKKLTSFV